MGKVDRLGPHAYVGRHDDGYIVPFIVLDGNPDAPTYRPDPADGWQRIAKEVFDARGPRHRLADYRPPKGFAD